MGRSKKKKLKVDDKNGSNNEYDDQKSKKDGSKRFVWSKRFPFLVRAEKTVQIVESEPEHAPQIVMDIPSKQLKCWNENEVSSTESHRLNIPIGPGRQVSTIFLSPTKVGFKAVVAHYGVHSNLEKGLTKDLRSISERIGNRRTLTLVFDMEQKTLEEIRKSEPRLGEGRLEESEMGDKRNVSASPLFVRSNAEVMVESTAFLQPKLSLDEITIEQSSVLISGTKSINLQQRHMSCKGLAKSCIAFKTLSEPMWREKERMRKEMIIQDNVKEVLNQFIFLDHDESLRNFPRIAEVEGKQKDSDLFSFEKVDRPRSSRNVSPNLLVNIKPFKEYVGIFPKSYEPSYNLSVEEVKPIISKNKTIFKNLQVKNRGSLCIRCGTDTSRTPIIKTYWDSVSGVFRNWPSNSTLLESRSRNALIAANRDELSCTLCSVWRLFNYQNPTLSVIALAGDKNIDDVVEELGQFDHGAIFKQNMSQFKRRIRSKESFSDNQKPRSSISAAECTDINKGKNYLLIKEDHGVEDNGFEDSDMFNYSLIEFAGRKNKTRGSKSKLEPKVRKHSSRTVRLVSNEKSNIFFLESSILMFTLREGMKMIKVMAEKIDQEHARHLCRVCELNIAPSSVTVIFYADKNGKYKAKENESAAIIQRHFSEDRLENFSKNLTYCSRSGKISGIINQLLSNKVDDLRNELIKSMKEARMTYHCKSNFYNIRPEYYRKEGTGNRGSNSTFSKGLYNHNSTETIIVQAVAGPMLDRPIITDIPVDKSMTDQNHAPENVKEENKKGQTNQGNQIRERRSHIDDISWMGLIPDLDVDKNQNNSVNEKIKCSGLLKEIRGRDLEGSEAEKKQTEHDFNSLDSCSGIIKVKNYEEENSHDSKTDCTRQHSRKLSDHYMRTGRLISDENYDARSSCDLREKGRTTFFGNIKTSAPIIECLNIDTISSSSLKNVHKKNILDKPNSRHNIPLDATSRSLCDKDQTSFGGKTGDTDHMHEFIPEEVCGPRTNYEKENRPDISSYEVNLKEGKTDANPLQSNFNISDYSSHGGCLGGENMSLSVNVRDNERMPETNCKVDCTVVEKLEMKFDKKEEKCWASNSVKGDSEQLVTEEKDNCSFELISYTNKNPADNGHDCKIERNSLSQSTSDSSITEVPTALNNEESSKLLLGKTDSEYRHSIENRQIFDNGEKESNSGKVLVKVVTVVQEKTSEVGGSNVLEQNTDKIEIKMPSSSSRHDFSKYSLSKIIKESIKLKLKNGSLILKEGSVNEPSPSEKIMGQSVKLKQVTDIKSKIPNKPASEPVVKELFLRRENETTRTGTTGKPKRVSVIVMLSKHRQSSKSSSAKYTTDELLIN